MTPANTSSPLIGAFDSGVGGLTVLDALRRRLPQAQFVYLGDVACAPYGEREPADVVDRCHRIVAHLASLGARLIVVACNTATVTAIAELRRRWPDLRFVGVEPGVKPAAMHSRSRRIAVMATPATAASPRLRDLIAKFANDVHVHVQPCPGLAALIEDGVHGGSALHATLAPLCDAIRRADVDTVVLGCTHYPFAADAIRALLGPQVTLVDTATAVAERVATVHSQTEGSLPGLRVISTGDSGAMALLLSRCHHLEQVTIERASI
ncbi:MAG: glutamate racemase [Burkholderiales bacterium]